VVVLIQAPLQILSEFNSVKIMKIGQILPKLLEKIKVACCFKDTGCVCIQIFFCRKYDEDEND